MALFSRPVIKEIDCPAIRVQVLWQIMAPSSPPKRRQRYRCGNGLFLGEGVFICPSSPAQQLRLQPPLALAVFSSVNAESGRRQSFGDTTLRVSTDKKYRRWWQGEEPVLRNIPAATDVVRDVLRRSVPTGPLPLWTRTQPAKTGWR